VSEADAVAESFTTLQRIPRHAVEVLYRKPRATDTLGLWILSPSSLSRSRRFRLNRFVTLNRKQQSLLPLEHGRLCLGRFASGSLRPDQFAQCFLMRVTQRMQQEPCSRKLGTNTFCRFFMVLFRELSLVAQESKQPMPAPA
jgi:hypothetical protein